MYDVLESLSSIIYQNIYIAPIICILAGLLSALLPCSLTQIPLLIAYLGGYENKNKSYAVKYSVLYAIGNMLVFVLLGILSSLIGKSFSLLDKKIYIVLGILMLIMFLQFTNIINIVPQKIKKPSTKKKGYLGAFIFGVIGGFFASPCSTPVLIAILTLVVPAKSIVLGTIMLFAYSLGNAIVIITIGSSIALAEKLANSEKFGIVSKIINVVISILILALGLYMLYLGF